MTYILGKALVHEWALLRWGVGKEYPRPGTDDPTSFVGRVYKPVGCNLPGSTNECSYFNDTAIPIRCGVDMAGLPTTLNPDGTVAESGCTYNEDGQTILRVYTA